ncbi:VOC family protein [Klebsiella pneumoniae]
MFSYIMLGTNDPQASYKFYAPLMRVLGHPLDGRMVALNAVSVDMVQELYRLAIENGGEDEGPPDYRPHYGADFYSAYVRDPDKNKIAFVFYDASKR